MPWQVRGDSRFQISEGVAEGEEAAAGSVEEGAVGGDLEEVVEGFAGAAICESMISVPRCYYCHTFMLQLWHDVNGFFDRLKPVSSSRSGFCRYRDKGRGLPL